MKNKCRKKKKRLTEKQRKFFSKIGKRPGTKRLITSMIFGRVLIVITLVIAQIVIILSLLLFIEPYLQKFILGGFSALTGVFAIYLSNREEKTEFKMAWLIPSIVFPFFGISLYFFYKLNPGNYGLKINLERVKQKSKPFMLTNPKIWNDLRLSPDILNLAYYLQTTGYYPAYVNTDIAYYPNGETFFKDLLIELELAENFIFIEFFIIGPGVMWNTILAILKKKAAAGVEVRIIWDGIGSLFLLPGGYSEYLESLGIQSKIHTPLRPILTTNQNNRDHRKIIVIDGITSFTGGANLSDEYINAEQPYGYWKDTMVKMRGEATKSFSIFFLQMWNVSKSQKENLDKYTSVSKNALEYYSKIDSSKQSQYPIKSGGFIIPYCDDAFNEKNIAENVYCDIISKAKWYVHITTPYTILDNELLESMIFAAKRGVDVSIVVPCKADHFITFCMGRTYLKTLAEFGVHVFEYMPGFIHAKMFVSDDEKAVVGSINLDYRSLYHHFECASFIYKNKIVYDIEQDFMKIVSKSKVFTVEDYKKIPVYQKMTGRIFKVFSPLF